MGDTRNYAALEWVIGEIGDTLKEARQALEAYVEDPKDSTRIRFCLTHIHQVHGTLQMVEFHGASLLAEEMEHLSQAILSDTVSSTAEAHEVLMRSLLQLPIYLDHVKTQRDDHPGVILPLLNDLRAVRKQSYLSETNLFAPDLEPASRVAGKRHPVTADTQKLKQVLLKLREMYQFAAAGVLRGVKLEENLGYLTKVCTRLDALTAGTPSNAIWHLAAALAEGLERDDIELSVAVRGLLRHLARELRILAEQGGKALMAPARESLLKNLLYYVARAEDGSERIAAIKSAYKLDTALLYGAGSVYTSDKDFISAPDPEAIRSVVAALQEEINAIKHILDISLTGQGGLDELAEVLPIVKRVADTLAVLGIGDLRKQILEQHEALTDVCESGELNEDRLMQVAGRIIEIEHRLQAIAKGAGKHRDLSSVDERGLEIDQAKGAVLAECQKGLEKAKDAIVEYIASKWDASHLESVSSLMSDIRGGLEIIPLTRPAAIMDACGRYVQEQLLDAQITPDWQTLDKLADTIAGVDYYLERLREDRDEDLDNLLDIAEESIQSLGYAATPRRPASAPAVSETAADADTFESELAIEQEHQQEQEQAPEAALEPEAQSDTEDSVDENEQPAASELSEQAESAPEDTDTAVDNAGVEAPPSAEADDAVAEPELLVEPEAETEQEAATNLVANDEEPDAETDPVSVETTESDDEAAAFDAESQQESAVEDARSAAQPEAESAEEESDIDDEIIEIFVEEAGEVQETLAEFFPKWVQNAADNESLTVVRRAFHTLKGSGRMVEAMEVGELAWSIENMLNRVLDKTVVPHDEHFALIDMVLAVLPEMVSAFEQRRPHSKKAQAEQYRAWAFAAADGDIPADLQRAASRWTMGSRDAAEIADEPEEAESVSASPSSADATVDTDDAEDGDDLVLWEIFASEAYSHLAAVEEFIEQMEEAAPLYTPPSDNMQRALHTLKGSAHMAHVTPIAELATPFESFMKELRAYQVNLNDDILQLIKDGVAYTKVGLEAIDENRPVDLPKLPQFVARAAELRELSVGHLVRQKEVEQDGHKQVDPRLLSIFMAEEMKLLLDADDILRNWQADLSNHTQIRPLVAELTTLESGATQANLPEMAELSELLRAIYEGCLDGSIEPRDEVFIHLQHGHDELLDLVDAVAAGQTLKSASPALLESLQALLKPNSELLQELDDSALDAYSGENFESEEIEYSLPVSDDSAELVEDGAPAASDEAPTAEFDGDQSDFSLADDGEALSQQTEADQAASADPADVTGETDDSTHAEAVRDDMAGDGVLSDGIDPDSGDHSEIDVIELDDSTLPVSEASDEAKFEFSSEFESAIAAEGEHVEGREISPTAVEEGVGEEAVDGEDLTDFGPVDDAFFTAEDGETRPEADAGLEDLEVTDQAGEPEASEYQADSEAEDLSPEDDAFDLELDLDSGLDGAAQAGEATDSLDVEDTEEANDSDAEPDAVDQTDAPDLVASEDASSADAFDTETDASAGAEPQATVSELLNLESEDYDEEIIEIFLEEADELIDELDEAVHTWESEWEDTESPDTMARALHTMKGGARLANLMDIGELTHEYETFLLGRGKELDHNFFQTIHTYQDRLLRSVRTIQAIVAGEAPPAESPPAAEDAAADDVASEESPAETQVTDPVPQSDISQSNVPTKPDAPARANVVPFAPKPPKEPARSEGGGFGGDFSMPPSKGGGAQAATQAAPRRSGPQEVIKISAELLEELVNLAGETSISRGRLETQVNDLGAAVDEIDGTLSRLQEQLRRLDIETEAQIIFRQEQMAEHEDFDPLEMDRYSVLQQLSRSLMESASDLLDLKSTLNDKIKDTETLLLQQSRVNTNLQEGLMRSRMVPFSRLVPRLRRIVRQVAAELGKEVNFEMDNVEGEMDRSVLERMVAPLEHMLRNAVDHGIEKPNDREKAGKPRAGRVVLTLAREGSDVLLRLVDDGRGINLERVREKAIERGLMSADAQLSDHDIMQFILHAGFSTAESVTQISGRGVGMDVVHAEIKQLGGSMNITSRAGEGTEFSVRLPFTVSVNRALMINLGADQYAIPLNAIEGIVRVSPFELEHYYSTPDARFEYAGENFRVCYLGSMLNEDLRPRLEAQSLPLPVILVRSEQNTMALQVDSLMGSREIVVKSLGSQFSTVQGLSGATVMGDGSVVVILDVHALVRKEMAQAAPTPIFAMEETARLAQQESQALKTVMVVDDSVTVRKVTTRFLEREGYNVITAKDGVDALRILQDEIPDVMLLDIEMPRMDGFEVAKNIRTTSRWQDIPIIMITSRTGEKHREHALSLGVNRYMGKPYQEEALLESINDLLTK
jgi:chemosensory pili system protein ChpA (sensor histidine kinase/response regulator)